MVEGAHACVLRGPGTLGSAAWLPRASVGRQIPCGELQAEKGKADAALSSPAGESVLPLAGSLGACAVQGICARPGAQKSREGQATVEKEEEVGEERLILGRR